MVILKHIGPSLNLHFFMHEIKAKLEELGRAVAQGMAVVELEGKRELLKVLNDEMQKSDFWDDQKKAQEVSQKASATGKLIETWEGMISELDGLKEFANEIPADDEQQIAEMKTLVEELENKWRKLEVSTFLSGKYDDNNAILSIHAGTGGTDASDFAEMLMRMFVRYSERMGWGVEMLDKSVAEEAGIKSATFLIKGELAYGYLKGEAGVHRLVRLSPFNAKNSRETSFVMIEVLPEIKNEMQVEIAPDDLRIDVFRSGGAGGQSVNTTDSAVRITHLPTGITVQCQNERSQLQNKEQAMRILYGKLVDLMEKEHAAELSDLKGKRVEMSWGNQIRSYVLHPYKMVKDHRTGYEESNPDRVLDGEIEGFIEAELKGVAAE